MLSKKFRDGTLPHTMPPALPNAELEDYDPVMVGTGRGQLCSVCEELIGEHDRLSVVFRYPNGPVIYFHRRCNELWLVERLHLPPRRGEGGV